jgi:hypothetical protein
MPKSLIKLLKLYQRLLYSLIYHDIKDINMEQEIFDLWSPTGKPCTVMVQGKRVVPLKTPLRGEHPAPEDQFTHG